MIDKKFIINLSQVLKHGSDGSYQNLLFRATLEDDKENVFVFDGFKILDIDEKNITTKLFVQQFTKEGKDLGFQSFDYKFNVSKMVKIANKKAIAKNHIELAFVDLFLNLYVKQIMAKNFNINNYVVSKEVDDKATKIELTEQEQKNLLTNKVSNEEVVEKIEKTGEENDKN